MPSTDDRPFHYAFSAAVLKSPGDWMRALLGNPLVSTGLVFLAIAVVFLFGPLALAGPGGEGDSSPGLPLMLAYFAAIGCGYMLIEISLLLKLQLYLGKPVYTLGVALFSFLLSSGIGSAVSSRFAARSAVRAAWLAALGIVVYGAVLQALWPHILEATIAQSTFMRSVIVVGIVFPLALLMGMFFPIGIRAATPRHRPMVPWFWAVNGCLSIVGIFASRIIGLFSGFSTAMTLGLALYVLTAVCLASYLAGSRAAAPAKIPA
jgi:hypothetical protein